MDWMAEVWLMQWDCGGAAMGKQPHKATTATVVESPGHGAVGGSVGASSLKHTVVVVDSSWKPGRRTVRV